MHTDEEVGPILLDALNELGVAVCISVAGGTTFTWANKAFCDMTGHSLDELLRISSLDLVPPEDIERLKKRSAARAERVSNLPEETHILRKDGAAIWVESSTHRLKDGARIITLFRDITARKQVEETKRAAEEAARAGAVTRDLVRQLLQRVSSQLGREGHATLMRAIGRDFARAVHAKTIDEYGAAFALMGLGHFKIESFEPGQLRVTAHDLIEQARGAPQPTCLLALGYLEAAASQLMGEDALGSEVHCESLGHASCEFVVRVRRARR